MAWQEGWVSYRVGVNINLCHLGLVFKTDCEGGSEGYILLSKKDAEL